MALVVNCNECRNNKSSDNGCLTLTWANRSAYDWVNGKQHSGLVNFLSRNRLYHLHNQVYLPINDAESLKLISKMALKNCDTHFRLENSNR